MKTKELETVSDTFVNMLQNLKPHLYEAESLIDDFRKRMDYGTIDITFFLQHGDIQRVEGTYKVSKVVEDSWK